MNAPKTEVERTPIAKIRRLILVALTVGVALFASAVFVLVQGIFDNFGPALKADLNWKVLRGAQDIARGADLGLAVQDAGEVRKAFEDYQKSEDVLAIVATDSDGKIVARYGETDRFDSNLFRGPASAVEAFDGYLVSWAPALIEGAAVGRVALVVSTRRLTDSALFLDRIRIATLAASLLALILGAFFVIYSTRQIALRDIQLAEYASSLEKKVEARTQALDQRNRSMRLVLDNVEEGLVTVALDGKMSGERSRALEGWFGVSTGDVSFVDFLHTADSKVAIWFEMGLEQLREDVMPIELLLEQLPKRMNKDERVLELSYRPIQGSGDTLEGLLVVFSDITERLARERLEVEQREMLVLFQRLSADRAAFLDFFEEANELVSKITAGIDSSEMEKRWVHTLKGNAGMFGLTAIAELCHELETRMAEESRPLNAEERERIGAVWAELRARVSALIGERRTSFVEVDQSELDAVIAMVEGEVERKTIAATLRSFGLEPVRLRFERLAEQAKQLAARLGKSELEVRIDSGRVRLESDAWRPFWSAFVHAIRNAVDHGIEDAELRRANNKPAAGTLSLTAKNENDEVTITLSDDGRGIDWERTRARAERLGLAADNTGDLRAALFKDGFTTRETASDVSGRGVGLGALREATEALGGSVHVRSTAGHGTEFEFRFRTP